MRNRPFDPVFLIAALAMLLAGAPPAYANAPAPQTVFAFEFVDENSQPVIPLSLQLTRCATSICHPRFLDLEMGTCDVPGCAEGTQFEFDHSLFTCRANFCYGHLYSWASWETRNLILVPQAEPFMDHALTGLVPKPDRDLGYGDAVGWRVVVTPDGLVITENSDVTARAPRNTSGYLACPSSISPAALGFVITQTAELLFGLIFLLILGIELAQVGGVLIAMALINFATYPVVWFTFPALSPASTTYAQALALLTLLVALIYAGLLIRLQPAFDQA